MKESIIKTNLKELANNPNAEKISSHNYKSIFTIKLNLIILLILIVIIVVHIVVKKEYKNKGN